VGSFCAKTGECLLEVRDLTVSYRPVDALPVRAVEGATFEVRQSEAIAILGESGSGKSTLAQALLRLLPPSAHYDRGSIHFCGRDFLALSDSGLQQLRGSTIALIPQDPALALNPVMQIRTQISEVLRAHRGLSRFERNRLILELLHEVGFEDAEQIANAYPHQLSGGQRQRVAIAQAISCRPAMIIADEPTSKLDASLQSGILALLAQIRREYATTFILITHDPAVASTFADRIFVMYSGRIVEQGTALGVLRHPLHPYTQGLVALSNVRTLSPSVNSRVAFPTIGGDPPDLTCPAAGCRFEPRCPERMRICTTTVPREFTAQPAHLVSCFKYEQ
jgi:oligopeptide transport system ATP-binding protein